MRLPVSVTRAAARCEEGSPRLRRRGRDEHISRPQAFELLDATDDARRPRHPARARRYADQSVRARRLAVAWCDEMVEHRAHPSVDLTDHQRRCKPALAFPGGAPPPGRLAQPACAPNRLLPGEEVDLAGLIDDSVGDQICAKPGHRAPHDGPAERHVQGLLLAQRLKALCDCHRLLEPSEHLRLESQRRSRTQLRLLSGFGQAPAPVLGDLRIFGRQIELAERPLPTRRVERSIASASTAGGPDEVTELR